MYSCLFGVIFLLALDILDLFLSFSSIIEFRLALYAFLSENCMVPPSPRICDKVVLAVLFLGDLEEP